MLQQKGSKSSDEYNQTKKYRRFENVEMLKKIFSIHRMIIKGRT